MSPVFMAQSSKKKPPENFEQAMAQLQEIAQSFESGALGLEESIKAYEESNALINYCYEQLDIAKEKIEILQKGKLQPYATDE